MIDTGKIRVSKLDAARRQLKCAIELWFTEKDQISIHTLICAAHQIIHDINKIKTGKPLLFSTEMIVPEYRQKWIDAVRKHMNFFKHADEDPNEVADFDPVISELFILVSLHGLYLLGETFNHTETAFYIWQIIHHPARFQPATNILLQYVSVHDIEEMKTVKKQDFLKGALLMLAQGSNI
jgi:hypothetical protein